MQGKYTVTEMLTLMVEEEVYSSRDPTLSHLEEEMPVWRRRATGICSKASQSKKCRAWAQESYSGEASPDDKFVRQP
jgi:hypothetical protein